jgi:hypothetical protein
MELALICFRNVTNLTNIVQLQSFMDFYVLIFFSHAQEDRKDSSKDN